MAAKKKATTNKSATQVMVEAMRAKLGKSAGAQVAEMAAGSISDVKEFIPSGISVIDHHLLGGGGLPVGRLTEMFGDYGTGKAQPLDAGVLTPTGYRPIGDLVVGDAIIGQDGKTHSVLGVFPQGEKEVYSVFTNDGGTTQCCGEHLWLTFGSNDVKRGKPGTVKSLNTIKDNLTEKRGEYTSWRHHIPVVKPIEFEPNSEALPLNPYLLGLLLGDGVFSHTVYFCKPEKDLQNAVAKLVPEGDELSYMTDGNGVRIVTAKHKQRSQTAKILETLNLMGRTSLDKFIPDAYLNASPENRLALLQGLIDTDGSVSNGGAIEYSTSSSFLAQGVMHIARSLGAIASISSRIPQYFYKNEKHKGALSYRIRIQMNNDLVPFRSEKHANRWKAKSWPAYRSIVRVEYVGIKECVCIKTSAEDSLYVTDDFIVTHNTSLAFSFMAACQRAGGMVGLAESEHALQIDRAVTFGVDPDGVVLTHPENLEDVLANAEAFMGAIPEGVGPNLWILDSIAACVTKAEREAGAGGNLRVGEFARRMSHGIKQLCMLAARTRTAILLTNQTRQKIGVAFGNPTTTPGGDAVKFYASSRLQLMGGSAVKVDDVPVGKDITIQCVKNKLVPPMRKTKVRFLYETGWHEQWSTLTYAKAQGVVGPKAQGMKGYREAMEALKWPEPEGLREEDAEVEVLSEGEALAELTGLPAED